MRILCDCRKPDLFEAAFDAESLRMQPAQRYLTSAAVRMPRYRLLFVVVVIAHPGLSMTTTTATANGLATSAAEH